MARSQDVELKDGRSIPAIGLGTWELRGDACVETVRTAIEIGYRHIDTALAYQNHEAIRAGLRGIDREMLFLTSKIPPDLLGYADAMSATDRILNELGTSYLDLLLVHWPNRQVDMADTFRALEEVQRAGKVRSIGVSNFTIGHLEEARRATDLPIVTNQVEFHPYLYQEDLFEYCSAEGICLTAYSPLARGQVLDDPVIREIAEQRSLTPSQVVLCWLLQKGMIVVPRGSSREHLSDNFRALGLNLRGEDILRIDRIKTTRRIIAPAWAEFDREAPPLREKVGG